jgi:hypothetical protein
MSSNSSKARRNSSKPASTEKGKQKTDSKEESAASPNLFDKLKSTKSKQPTSTSQTYQIDSGLGSAESSKSQPKVLTTIKAKDQIHQSQSTTTREYKFKSGYKDPNSKDYKGYWIEESLQGDDKFYCLACKEHFKITTLWGARGHESTPVHQTNEEVWLNSNASEESDSKARMLNFAKKVKLIEFKICKFVVENNLSFEVGEKLADLIKDLSNDPLTLKKAYLDRKKISTIVCESFAPLIKNKIETKLAQSSFSILVDEVTDSSHKQYMATMVQYVDGNHNLASYLYSLKDTHEKRGAEGLYDILKEEVIDKPFGKNLASIATDNASIMKGSKTGLGERISKLCPWIVHNFCISHGCNLVSQFATKGIPFQVESFVRSVYGHFAHSPQRISEWVDFQEAADLEPYRVLNYAVTRWLSLEASVSRVLERWEELRGYFNSANGEDVKKILKQFDKHENKIYLQFVKVMLKSINILNQVFQRKEMMILKVEKEIKHSFSSFMNLVLKDEFRLLSVQDKCSLLHRNQNLDVVSAKEDNLKNLEDFQKHFLSIYKTCGIDFKTITDKSKLDEILKVMRDFILRVAWKMKEILPLNDEFLSSITTLNPNEFLLSSWKELGERFVEIIIKDDFEFFYRELESFEESLSENRKIFMANDSNPSKFYLSREIKDQYPSMSKLAITILSIPYSTADLERSFSQLKLIKTPLRNSLKDSTTESLLMTKIGFNLVDLADSATVDTLILLLNTSQKMKRNEEAKIPIDSAKRKLDENELSPRTEDDHQHKKMKLNQDLATTNRSNSSNNVDSIEDKSQDHISIGEENKI